MVVRFAAAGLGGLAAGALCIAAYMLYRNPPAPAARPVEEAMVVTRRADTPAP